MESALKRISDVVWSPYLWMGVAFLSLGYAYWVTRKLLIEPFQAGMADFESAPKMCPHLVNAMLATKKAIEVYKQKEESENVKRNEAVVANYEKKIKEMDCYKYVELPKEEKPVVEPLQGSILTPVDTSSKRD